MKPKLNTRLLSDHKRTRPTKEEELALVGRIQQGDLAARNELVERHLALAVYAVRNALGLSNTSQRSEIPIDVDDALQEACLGMIRAAEKYDPSKGTFPTYAMRWMRSFIQKAVRRERLVAVPDYIFNVMRYVANGEGHRASPCRLEFARHANYTIADVGAYEENDNAEAYFLASVPDATQDIERAETCEIVRQAVDGLAERQRRVVSMLFGLETEGKEALLKDVGKAIGCTREWVRHLRDRSLDQLHETLSELA